MPLIVPLTRPRPSATRAAVALLATGATLALGLTGPADAASRPPTPTSVAAHGSGATHWLTWSEGVSKAAYVVQQAKNASFTSSAISYHLRGPGRAFTPYRITKGTTYYYRVRAVASGLHSGWSRTVSFRAGGSYSSVRVLSYNSLSAASSPQHPGGTMAPWKDRRPAQLSLLQGSKADVIGLQEGAACIIKYTDGTNCYRQVDSIADGLSGSYSLIDTMTSDKRSRYAGDYILYRDTVTPVGSGGTWYIGDNSTDTQWAAYQIFRVPSTGATFLFVCTHLVTGHNLAGDKHRAAETSNMVKAAKAFAANHGVKSIVYVGDFNSYYGEYDVNDLTGGVMRQAHIPDAIETAGSYYRAQYDSINGLYRHPRQGHGSIDHIYASGGVGTRGWGELLNIKDGVFVGTIPSDHNPIYAGLAIPY